jgi:hypothetical protein
MSVPMPDTRAIISSANPSIRSWMSKPSAGAQANDSSTGVPARMPGACHMAQATVSAGMVAAARKTRSPIRRASGGSMNAPPRNAQRGARSRRATCHVRGRVRPLATGQMGGPGTRSQHPRHPRRLPPALRSSGDLLRLGGHSRSAAEPEPPSHALRLNRSSLVLTCSAALQGCQRAGEQA